MFVQPEAGHQRYQKEGHIRCHRSHIRKKYDLRGEGYGKKCKKKDAGEIAPWTEKKRKAFQKTR